MRVKREILITDISRENDGVRLFDRVVRTDFQVDNFESMATH